MSSSTRQARALSRSLPGDPRGDRGRAGRGAHLDRRPRGGLARRALGTHRGLPRLGSVRPCAHGAPPPRDRRGVRPGPHSERSRPRGERPGTSGRASLTASLSSSRRIAGSIVWRGSGGSILSTTPAAASCWAQPLRRRERFIDAHGTCGNPGDASEPEPIRATRPWRRVLRQHRPRGGGRAAGAGRPPCDRESTAASPSVGLDGATATSLPPSMSFPSPFRAHRPQSCSTS